MSKWNLESSPKVISWENRPWIELQSTPLWLMTVTVCIHGRNTQHVSYRMCCFVLLAHRSFACTNFHSAWDLHDFLFYFEGNYSVTVLSFANFSACIVFCCGPWAAIPLIQLVISKTLWSMEWNRGIVLPEGISVWTKSACATDRSSMTICSLWIGRIVLGPGRCDRQLLLFANCVCVYLLQS